MEISWNVTQGSFNGTIQEFDALTARYPALVAALDRVSVPPSDAAPQSEKGNRDGIAATVVAGPTKEAFAALIGRRPLGVIEERVLRGVLNAGESGVTSTELARVLAIEPQSVRSAMRHLGKRAANTKAWPRHYQVFDRTWLGTENRYRAWPEMGTALDPSKP